MTGSSRRFIDADDIEDFAVGAAILGTGGGGSVDTQKHVVASILREAGPVPVIRVNDLGPDDAVVVLSTIGAPAVGIEMLAAQDQPEVIVREVERILEKRVTAVMAAEVGGSNGLAPIGWAGRLSLPILDADGMGRAFPEATMSSMNVAELPVEFAVMSDVVGNVTRLRPINLGWLERQARALCVASGASSMIAHYVLTAVTAQDAVIEGTMSLALAIGQSVRQSKNPVHGLVESLDATLIVEGKVADIDRRTAGGFTRGSVTIVGTGKDAGRIVRVEIQNENLIAMEDGSPLAMVPDLISIVDEATSHAIPTEVLRFGHRVALIAWRCDPLWRTVRGLSLAGPRAFGYDIDFTPIESIGVSIA